MSVLTLDQVKEKYNNPDVRLDKAKKEHKELLMHVHGIGVSKFIEKIEGLENDVKKDLRKRLTISNKSLWSEILNHVDKVFSANGGSRQYNLKNKKQSEQFSTILNNITEGISIRKWMQNYWKDKITVDPNGIFLIENDGKDAYPTYKSILTIRDYSADGQDLDYIIFEPKKHDKYELVRVYDDYSDRTYKVEGDSWQLLEEFEYLNKWSKVPGVIISDYVDTITELKESAIAKEIELSREYLRQNSVFILLKYHHGFPFFWQYMQACPTCKGTGSHNNTDCKTCNGSGYSMKKDVSDVTYLKPPTDTDQPIIAPNLGGYVVPPIESIDMLRTELKDQKNQIKISHWGTIIESEGIERTATEVTLNAQPVQDRLNVYSDSEEIVEQKLIDYIGKFYYPDTYKSCSINNGRNYIIKGANQALKEYTENRKQGASDTVLNDLLLQYYDVLYQNDSINLSIHKKLIQVEPLIHYSVGEVSNMNLPTSIKNAKYYYNEWLSTMNQDQLFSMNEQQLRESLNIYVKSKSQENEMQSNSSIASDDNQRQEV